MSERGMPDGPWGKARCPGCARWIAIRPKVGGFRAHKIGLKSSDPLCPGGGSALIRGAPVLDVMARVRAVLDSWTAEERAAAQRILGKRHRRR